VLGGSSLVPKGLCRVIDLGPVRRGTGKGKGYDKTVKIFSPGTIADAESYILKLGAEVMDVRASGPEIIIDSDKGQKVLRKNAALKHLVLDWGLGETDARDLVKYASRKTDRYYVKRAQPESELIRTAPGGPSINIDSNSSPADGTPPGVPVQNEDTRFEQVPGMVPDAGNRDAYKLLDDPEVQQALAAAEKGQKEVFDTSVVGGLVKAVDVNSLVNDMIPDIIKGMDRVGRILFMFYWHNEQFRDRYGRQDMMDLEDSLRNMFSGVGDLALFMKQKTIEPNPGTDAIDINLEKPAG